MAVKRLPTFGSFWGVTMLDTTPKVGEGVSKSNKVNELDGQKNPRSGGGGNNGDSHPRSPGGQEEEKDEEETEA